MIAFGVRYLCGYAGATNLPLERAEWPVHSGRVFMAMAAAHHESGANGDERAALEWLEHAGAPEMRAGDGIERSLVKTYVPVNDAHGGILRRSRQEKALRRVWLEDDTAYLIWRKEPPQPIRTALDALCNKVTRIGHSSSLVQMWVIKPGEEPEPNLVPDPHGRHRMRVAAPGTMAELDRAFNARAFTRWACRICPTTCLL